MSADEWRVANSEYAKHGRMICCTCNQPIGEDADYQYRQKTTKHDWYYQVQHRECAPSQDKFIERDKEQEQYRKRQDFIDNVLVRCGLDRVHDAEETVEALIEYGFLKETTYD